MAFYGAFFPSLKLALGGGAGCFGQQTQRVAAEIGRRLPVGAEREVKFLSEASERVGSVLGRGKSGRGVVGHVKRSAGPTSPRHR